jgi:Putative zinc-finger
MVVNCEQVWREISNYIEGEVDETLRTAIEAHFEQCDAVRRARGTRNVIELYGDERMIDVTLGHGRFIS